MNPTEETASYEDNVAIMNAAENPDTMEDAISALVNLGYQRLEAYKAVNKAAKNKPDAGVSDLIKLALREFAQKD